MADFVDPVVTQEIVDAKDKLVVQANRAEQVINNWESCQPIPEAPIDGKTYGRKDAAWTELAQSGDIPDRVDAIYDDIDKNFLFLKLDTSATLSQIPLSNALQAGLMSKEQAVALGDADNELNYPEGRFNPLQPELFQIKNSGNNDTRWLTLPNASGGQTGLMLEAESVKLAGVEDGAQVNKFDFNDAPIDGNQYARQNGAWAVVTGGGGGSATWGSITGTLSNQTDLQNALNAKLDSTAYTAADVKAKYESNANTNAFTDAEQTKLSGIETGAEVNNISDINANDLTDGGDSTLHFHASDRNRANHTGTQTASTISDFDTEVANNTAVAANTAKVSFPEAPSDGTPYARQDGGWVAAGGGGGFASEDITNLSIAQNRVFLRSVGSFSVFSGSLGTGDGLLTELINRGLYPAGTTWDDVSLSVVTFVKNNLQSVDLGDGSVAPTGNTGATCETVFYIERSLSTNLLKEIHCKCTILVGVNAGKVYYRNATDTATGSWAEVI